MMQCPQGHSSSKLEEQAIPSSETGNILSQLQPELDKSPRRYQARIKRGIALPDH
jgi:hypothetical protein